MKSKTILLLIVSMLFSSILFAWGEAKTKKADDIIVISGNAEGQYIILPKTNLVTILDIKSRQLIFQYGASAKPIRNMKFKNPESALKIFKQLYPKYFCLDELGLSECKIEDVLGKSKK